MDKPVEFRVGQSISHFGLQYLRQTEVNANAVFSPISLVTALYIVLLGTQKNSKSANELSKLFNYQNFHLDLDENEPHKGLSAIYRYLSNSDTIAQEQSQDKPRGRSRSRFFFGRFNYNNLVRKIGGDYGDDQYNGMTNKKTNSSKSLEFNMGNLLLSNKEITGNLKKDFRRTLTEYYNITLAQFNKVEEQSINDANLDLLTKAQNNDREPIVLDVSNKMQLIDIVNEWVNARTQKKIKSILNNESFDDLNSLACVLINAVHLKAKWKQQYFDTQDTQDLDFYNEGSIEQKKKVPFMRTKKSFRLGYFDSEQSDLSSSDINGLSSVALEALEIPYQGSGSQRISLVILMPKDMNQYSELEQGLSWSALTDVYRGFNYRTIKVTIPKFKLEQSYQSKRMLQEMGASSMFSDASLTDIFTSNNNTITISDVIHKAMIQVDEVGVEAAAATSINVVARSMREPDPITFLANRPFIFVVRHLKTNSPLFVGRVMKL